MLERYYADLCCSDDREYYRIVEVEAEVEAEMEIEEAHHAS